MVPHQGCLFETMVKHRFDVSYVFHLVFLVVEITSFTNVSAISSFSESCNRSRLVLTETYGIISSGGNKYPMVSHCEWLIKANDSGQFITLHFNKMDTECSYDHIFIYDGNSYTSPVLASFSGNSSPPDITATSGAMLILFYSDTNYVRTGFEATYSVTDCPHNCSHRGPCEEHQCLCTDRWTGKACERDWCPSDCGDSDGRGKCVSISKHHSAKCQCKIGYSGIDCSLPDSNKNEGNSWHVLSPDGMGLTGRAGHTGVYIPTIDRFYVFGGYTFSHVLGDLLYFEFSSSTWVTVNPPASPAPRRHHAAVEYGTNIILYGGELDERVLSNELWLFNVTSHTWQLLYANDSISSPPLSKHSLTLVDDKWLYLFGGHRQDGSISSDMYKINLYDAVSWEKVPYLGGRRNVPKVVGHSAVYHPPYKTILIFGGVTTETSNLSKLSSSIHAFHTERKFWTNINYHIDKNTPLERAFHTAAIVGEYMVVHGGYTHKHSEEEICYDNATHLYHLKCHKWVNLLQIAQDFKGSENPIGQGVFSHAMGVRHGHTLLIHGGYSGIMRSSFLAYVLPSSIAGGHPLSNPCSRHKIKDSCVANIACGWCSILNACVERSYGNETCANLFTEPCPGFCPALSNCYACLIWGESAESNTISDSQLIDPFPTVSCAWCVQAVKCFSVDDPPMECSQDSNSSNDPQDAKWWGSEGTEIHNLSNCTSQDFPPGLISVVYRFPTDLSVPDNVSYISNASESLETKSKFPCGNHGNLSENKNGSIVLKGFLHPLGVRPKSERIPLQMQMCSKNAAATLKLSTDSTSEHLEKVAHHQMGAAYICTDVRQSHKHNSPLFPELSKGHKYLLNFEVQISGCINETITSHLSWNANAVQSEVISKQYLELYRNGTLCETKDNCLACLTDNLCAWCEAHSKCYNRMKGSGICHSKAENYFLVTQPADCSICKDRGYCEQCLEAENCEWVDDAESSECSREGRHADAVPWNGSCPTPCYLRTTCASCLGEPGFCTWCESTQTCFMFSTYTSSYMYGQCRDWVDEKRSRLLGLISINPVSMCRDCSSHNTCQSCLSNLNCGWCYNIEYPNNGTCVLGDFSGPSAKNCTTYLEEKSSFEGNSSSPLYPSEVFWSYSRCPDVNECLESHNCHPNATCTNTPDSYTCECNTGFQGDGKTCNRVCAVKCIYGICSDEPEYKCICDLGWTGEDCSVNCGCHNHSTCSKGIGICDECQNLTEGQFCEKCMIGSYGDATTSAGCLKCNCNYHGRPELGYCNITTGECFCKDNTRGPNCSKCPPDYYGDPRNGGSCFLKCLERAVITSVQNGKLGSPANTNPSSDCLWILTVNPILDMLSLLEPMPSPQAIIKLDIHNDIRIRCPLNHVYVYDGLPDFIASGHPNVLLGAFCGWNVSSSMTVVARSGYLTIHFKRNQFAQGFNASYERFDSCSEACAPAQEMGKVNVTEHCCGRKICPRDCLSSKNQGLCDAVYRICNCSNSFGGEDCSVPLKPHDLIWRSVYDYDGIITNMTDAPPARMGGSLLTVWNEANDVANLWLYGGYSAKFPDMNDIFMFDTLNKRWTKISGERTPPQRYFHAATVTGYFIYVYGGLSQKEILGDFWEFNTVNRTWSQLKTQTLPPLACSTLTAIKDERLVLIGGYSPAYGFFDKILEFDIENDIWYTINSTGTQPTGIYGHTSVYHFENEIIYVYGGIVHNGNRVFDSSTLYAFHYTLKHWHTLPPDNRVNPLHTRPLSRYFHAAVVTEKYMIVIGGRSSNVSKDYPQPYAYIFSCNLWIPLTDKDIEAVGDPPDLLVGTSAAIANQNIYLFGGSDGRVNGELKVLSIPPDFCNLFSHNRIGCIYHTGCAFCNIPEKGVNQTFCYSENWRTPSSCNNPKKSSEVTRGTMCNADWIGKRDCAQYTSCADCLTSWLVYPEAKQMCQWCPNCRSGKCVSLAASCDYLNDCGSLHRAVNQTPVCLPDPCSASDCAKCHVMKGCMWTRLIPNSAVGQSAVFRDKPTHDWICIVRGPLFPGISLRQCPAYCYQHSDCTSCLNSIGGEGGWHECHWSGALNQCMSPSFELIRCEDGSCGPVLQGNDSVCPVPCWQHSQASHCLSHAHCGWCAFSGSKVDGRGLCIEGGIMGPSATAGKCKENNVLIFGTPLPEEVEEWLELSEGPPEWAYLAIPPENECANDHHTCDEKHEECVDTPEGFKCQCKSGYSSKDGHCKPICKQGCVNGTCISPDVCSCNFGYVGDNCSIPCKCNGHSNCPGPEQLNVCTECHNDTQGPECQKCKPLYVGNPVNGGKCIPCHLHCNGHSHYCFSSEFRANNNASLIDKANMTDLLEKLTEGALENDAECWKCQNHTQGSQCDKCVDGYFKVGEKISEGCRLCECHGHGDTCNPDTGENCVCQNFTETQCSQKNTKNIMTPCWQLQCSKCKEYFLGAPSYGHQCYRHMFMDKDYCFDPITQGDCNIPNALLQGRTVFFAVQPRYMNVDIRIVVDVTKGGIDFFLSAKEDTFVVEVNKTNGIHHISLDKKYGTDIWNDFDTVYNDVKPKAKRETFVGDSSRDSFNLSDSYSSAPLHIHEVQAKGLTTYVTVKKSHEFLLIRSLQNRLVITIPQEVHDLRSTRFYMVLRGTGSKSFVSTYGNLFFRQDQTRIDLFVFFSVFFSCFFLFLAICVVIWKVKQAFDLRRARRLHAAEMKHMASRPFGHIITIIEDEPDEYDFMLYSPSNHRKKSKQVKAYGRDSPKILEDKFGIRPIAIEPLSDGSAAVATILIQLPGGQQSLVKMTLASALITTRSSHHHVTYGLRAAMRRRTSHANV